MASVWEQSRETDRRMQETDRRMQETDRLMQETSKRIAETDRIVKETSAQMKETDRRIEESRKETDRRIEESRKETDRQIKELRASQEETAKFVHETTQSVKALSKKHSKLDDEWGRFLEEMCVPATLEIFKHEGINITQRYMGMTHAKDDEGDEMEVDVILCNSTEAVAIEVKANCTQEHIDHFISQMQLFKKIFHPFDRFKVYAAIVGMKFQTGVEKYARKKGLYVIRCTAEGAFSLIMKPDPEKRLCL